MNANNLNFSNNIWGEITEYTHILPNVYHLYGKLGSGIAMPISSMESLLSQQLCEIAIKKNDTAYFTDGHIALAVQYELLLYRFTQNKDMSEQMQLYRQCAELVRIGRLDFPEYFGECAPPSETHIGAVGDFRKVTNGIYFVTSNGTSFIAVHEAIAETRLTSIARLLCEKNQEYLFFDEAACAAPIYELCTYHPSKYRDVFDIFTVSWDALYATLRENFQCYVILMEAEGEKIPESESPAEAFLFLSAS